MSLTSTLRVTLKGIILPINLTSNLLKSEADTQNTSISSASCFGLAPLACSEVHFLAVSLAPEKRKKRGWQYILVP